jgi:oligopeptidase B
MSNSGFVRILDTRSKQAVSLHATTVKPTTLPLLCCLLCSQEAYRYIRSYSPYSNIQPAATYPALLLTASLHDTRVNFWEPAKYVAAMRYYKQQQQQQGQQQQNMVHPTDGLTADDAGSSSSSSGCEARPMLLLTDMHAGHFAASAASSRLQEHAMKLAFILHSLGVPNC